MGPDISSGDRRRNTSNPSSSLVWYAVYGSNLLRSRFMRYLEGNQRSAHSLTLEGGISGDAVRDSRPYRLEFELYFAHERSRNWGEGGVAFVELDRVTPPPTLGRVYLLTLGQFEKVARGENGVSTGIRVTGEELLSHTPVNIGSSGWYRVLLPLGNMDAVPIVTLTGRPEETLPRRQPSERYKNTIRAGLQETYPDLTKSEITEYLQTATNRA